MSRGFDKPLPLISQGFDQSPDNPLNWPARRKWRVVGIACLLTFLVGLNASAPTTAFPEINNEFSIPEKGFETTFFMISTWNVAAGLFPMLTLSLMDTYGTYKIYVISYALFLLFVLPQALAPDFATLVVVRGFAGAFGGTLQNGTEAVIANLFSDRKERLLAVTFYVLALAGGVTLGPVQGALVHLLTWRWVFWIQLILYGAMLPIVVVCLQETRGSVIRAGIDLQEKTPQKQEITTANPSAGEEIMETLARSAKLLASEFIVFSFMLWSAFSYGLIFVSTESIAVVFGATFGFEPFQSGLILIAMFLGEILGAMACICFQQFCTFPFTRQLRSRNKNSNIHTEKSMIDDNGQIGGLQQEPPLERELYLSIPATIIGLSGGLFIYGWTGLGSSMAPWVAPAIGLALQGFAVQIILTGTTIYLTECYGIYAASAVAATAVGENIFAAFLPLASLPMYENLGFQWASSLLALLGLTLILPPIALIIKGPSIRARSKAIQELSRK